jgi:nucleoside-diphosphate-sugar epimerase/predicted dehydrogenase
MTRVGLVGAGFIARVHAEALASLRGRRVAAVIDPDLAAAERLALGFGARAFASAEEALAEAAFERAHVLVPPDLHAAVAEPLLRAGIPVLLEKPLATSRAECERLVSAAGPTPLGVNQNFVHHPAFARLRACVAAGAFGRLEAVSCVYNVPLRQLAARQFGHWMFRSPTNLLLEQAVHPLSQIVSLAGPVADMRLFRGPATEIAPGVPFVGELGALLACAVPAQLRFAVGRSFPFWQVTAVCSDGVIIADMLANRMHAFGRTRFMEPVDAMLSGLRTAGMIARDAVGGLAGYALAMARLRGRSDAFFRSMKASVAEFHAAVDAARAPPLDGAFGAGLVALCEAIAAEAMPALRPTVARSKQAGPSDVAVLGGTGFIGTAVVRQLRTAGRRVTVMARNTRNLPAVFDDPGVRVLRGDIGDAEAVAAAVAECRVVVNLAHGGGGADYAAVRWAMVGGAAVVAEACRAAGVRRLLHLGSIASLYLGPQSGPVTGATPPDPLAEQRADYARAKAECDRMLLGLHRDEGLPVVILRPGLVVGEGSSPFHSGVGFYNNEQHCIGWNAGRNELPFVLVEDVAAAIVAACEAPGIEGRCYNLVGDVRPNARAYTADLGRALGRPLRFHPRSPNWLWFIDMVKWTIKRAGGRAVPRPSRRDFLSRGLAARFDCTDTVRDLGWQPNADPAVFHARAIAVHAAG